MTLINLSLTNYVRCKILNQTESQLFESDPLQFYLRKVSKPDQAGDRTLSDDFGDTEKCNSDEVRHEESCESTWILGNDINAADFILTFDCYSELIHYLQHQSKYEQVVTSYIVVSL